MFRDRGAKPAYASFRHPFVATKRGGRIRFWGQVRPGGRHRVDARAQAGGRWKQVARARDRPARLLAAPR